MKECTGILMISFIIDHPILPVRQKQSSPDLKTKAAQKPINLLL